MKINFRSFVYSFIMLIATILGCLIALNVSWLGFFMIILAVFAPLITVVFIKKRIATYKFATIIMTSVLCFVCTFLFFTKVYTWTPYQINSDYYSVSGYVSENYVSDGQRIIILDELELDNTFVSGKMKITVNSEGTYERVSIGDRIEFSSYVLVRDIVEDFKVNANYLRSNIRYSSSIYDHNVSVFQGEASVIDKINGYVRNKLTENMGEKYGFVAYGILTGDKNEISTDLRDAFTVAGIAHILAVSGLHIGFLMTLVLFVLRKLKIKRLTSFVISIVVLVVYSAFAGFSPSVIRASIMFLVGSGAYLLGEQRDSFNALGLAATCILTFSPLLLFEAGFVMSVSAVFGIVNFSSAITQGLAKIKIPSIIAQAIAISTSAQLGILPASIIFFGYLQLYSIAVNVILMPIMSVAFMAVFVSMILSLAPIFDFLITVSGVLVQALSVAADFCAALPYAQVVITSSVAAVALYPAYFVMGNYFYCKRKKAVSLISALIAFLMLIILLLI